jgi:hypothetical protein
MALDKPCGDGVDGLNEDSPAVAAQTELAEPRSRAEYYDALHGEPFQEPDGWDTVDARDRPPLEEFRVSPERRAHILDGDTTGGGHRHGTGSPGKTEFPASWDDEKVVGNILAAARHPDLPPVHQQWNGRWLCVGTRDEVEVSVVVERSGEIWTAWPEEGGPGVRRNPPKGTS